MQEVNSLCSDSQVLRVEYCIVGIPHITAIYLPISLVVQIDQSVQYVSVSEQKISDPDMRHAGTS